MKTILLNRIEIKIGSQVRFVNDKDLYTKVEGVNKPVVGKVYTVRDINDKEGFLLEEVKNIDFDWYNLNGGFSKTAEPGFAHWRFEPATPLRKKKIVQIEILPQVEERLYRPKKVETLETV